MSHRLLGGGDGLMGDLLRAEGAFGGLVGLAGQGVLGRWGWRGWEVRVHLVLGYCYQYGIFGFAGSRLEPLDVCLGYLLTHTLGRSDEL